MKLSSCAAGYGVCNYNSSGELSTDGTRAVVPGTETKVTNPIVGFLLGGMGPEGSVHMYSAIGPLARFVNQVSKVHDFFNQWNYNDMGLRVGGGLSFEFV